MLSVKVEPGDLVRVIAPAGRAPEANIPRMLNYLDTLGLRGQISAAIYDPTEPFYSNTDDFRAADLISAILDVNCKVIWCIRGGAGCIRLIKYLESQLPVTPLPPKILIGFSDITVLHLYLAKKYNWPTIHGAMLDGIVTGQYDSSYATTVTALQEILFANGTGSICEPTMTRIDDGSVIPSLNAQVTGGNLSVVQCSIGTGWQINGEGKIIFLEDVGEAPYRIERMLDQLKQAGVFQRAAAVVFGDFTDADQDLVRTVVNRFVEDETITCPVFRLTGIGHGSTNSPLPLNTDGLIVLQNETTKAYGICFGDLEKAA